MTFDSCRGVLWRRITSYSTMSVENCIAGRAHFLPDNVAETKEADTGKLGMSRKPARRTFIYRRQRRNARTSGTDLTELAPNVAASARDAQGLPQCPPVPRDQKQ